MINDDDKLFQLMTVRRIINKINFKLKNYSIVNEVNYKWKIFKIVHKFRETLCFVEKESYCRNDDNNFMKE